MTDGKHKVTVPRHEVIKRGTLLSIIQQAGLTKEEFMALLTKKRVFHDIDYERPQHDRELQRHHDKIHFAWISHIILVQSSSCTRQS